MSETDISIQQKAHAIFSIVQYRLYLTSLIVISSFLVAMLEGIGLGFIVPIIELLQSNAPRSTEVEGVMYVFLQAYRTLGIPFTLSFVVGGVTIVMGVRYLSSFLVDWLRTMLTIHYLRDLQKRAFDQALSARIKYFDRKGTDEILNTIVTQIPNASGAINQIVNLFQQMLLILMYFGVSFYFAPSLTVVAVALLGGVSYVSRAFVESGYVVGNRVAQANERIQSVVQAGTQGIRDVKLFQLTGEIFENFDTAIEQYVTASIALYRNEAFVENAHKFLSSVVVFLLIIAGHRFAGLSLTSLGVFLFAMFRLAPQITSFVHQMYQIEGTLPHFIRTQAFIEEMESYEKVESGDYPVPESIDRMEFQDVTFSYCNSGPELRGLSLEVKRGDFVALVGPSGAGKSTVVSLLTRFYDPDSGRILADRTPISQFKLESWRSKFAVVRQQPFLFNDTLRYNVTLGKRNVSDAELERACRIARVSEFFDELPEGYETVLGEDGVQLSGGQQQRVALARALLRDAEILILDEAMSDLDSSIEQQVYREITSTETEYTIIMIAHRLSTVTDADRIYTIADGEVVQRGTHEQLVERDGIYSRLYSLQ